MCYSSMPQTRKAAGHITGSQWMNATERKKVCVYQDLPLPVCFPLFNISTVKAGSVTFASVRLWLGNRLHYTLHVATDSTFLGPQTVRTVISIQCSMFQTPISLAISGAVNKCWKLWNKVEVEALPRKGHITTSQISASWSEGLIACKLQLLLLFF